MTDYHEPLNELSPLDRDITRAFTSLKEEIEAANWYNQRVVTCSDDELRRVLVHNRDEEIEHACMVIEWLRRKMDVWDKEMKAYFFTEKPIVELEDLTGEGGGDDREREASPKTRGDIGIGSLKSIRLERG